MATYKISDFTVSSHDTAAFQQALEWAYNAVNIEEARPRCLCRRSEPGHEHDEGIPMYVSRLENQYICKRMPNSALEHTGECDSYELPSEMTGYGAVLGSAIQEGTDGLTTLKLDYSLSEGGGRAPSVGGVDSEKSEIEADSKKLTMRATLHYLWTQAELHKWAPGFAGKRNWVMVSSRIHAAIQKKTTKGFLLSDVLFVPEAFKAEAKNEIAARRLAKLSKIASGDSGKKRLMLLIAEFKEIQHTPYGHNFVAKHMPDFPFLMEEKFLGDFSKTFKSELEMLRSNANCHLMTIATFSFSDMGVASLKKMGVMLVNENWLPFEDSYEKQIIDALSAKGRRFEIILRFNQRFDRPRPSIILKDAAPKITALYIIPKGVNEEYYGQRLEQASNCKYLDWSWEPALGDPYSPLPISMEEADKIDRENAGAPQGAPLPPSRGGVLC